MLASSSRKLESDSPPCGNPRFSLFGNRSKIVHFTTGAPYMAGHEVDLYADEWFDELTRWAA